MSWIYRMMALWQSAQNSRAAVQKARGIVHGLSGTLNTVTTSLIQKELARANQGSAAAQYNLGERYCEGRSLPQDFTEAARWFHRSAEQGYAKAQSVLGMMYLIGRGVAIDRAEAWKWTQLAAQQGDKYALKNRQTLQKRLSPDELRQGHQRARTFKSHLPANRLSKKEL